MKQAENKQNCKNIYKNIIKKDNSCNKIIALAGNPNVGKSTVFNQLTGLNQHTGNWPGKTVSSACGKYTYSGTDYFWWICWHIFTYDANRRGRGCKGLYLFWRL